MAEPRGEQPRTPTGARAEPAEPARSAESDRDQRPSPGWREVLVVAAAIVGVVLAAAVLTSVLPTQLQQLVFRTPLAIVVLIAGTVWLLVRVARARPPD